MLPIVSELVEEKRELTPSVMLQRIFKSSLAFLTLMLCSKSKLKFSSSVSSSASKSRKQLDRVNFLGLARRTCSKDFKWNMNLPPNTENGKVSMLSVFKAELVLSPFEIFGLIPS